MVKGFSVFSEHFRPFSGSFIIIGGAACDVHFESEGLAFRATRDLDLVILLESFDRDFAAALREFVARGRYQIRERTDQRPILHRFAKPADERYPAMLELFSRAPDEIAIEEGQRIVPVEHEPGHRSLSAILLDDTYHGLICGSFATRKGLRFATIETLIALKARAWIDLTTRRGRGDRVDLRDIEKHRNDVFRLATILPGTPGSPTAGPVAVDVARFLAAFPDSSVEWPRILAALGPVLGGGVRPSALREAVRSCFGLPEP
jgi:hypothetical protein